MSELINFFNDYEKNNKIEGRLTFNHSLAKSSEYYQQTLINVLTECDNSKCRNEIFEMEINKAFFNLISAIMDQLRWEISQKEKDILNK